jgi:hypothetical protein
VVLLLLPAWAAGQAAPDRPETQGSIDAAIARAVGFLLKQFTEAGPVRQEGAGSGPTYSPGRQTAMTVYALLAAGVPADTPQLQRALDWLVQVNTDGTRAVAARAMALAAWNDKEAVAPLTRDARRLMSAAGGDGGYGETLDSPADAESDNLSSQWALLGVWAASRRGVAVPDSYWQRQHRYWLACQQIDGGWNFRPGDRRASYGSTTAAGLAALIILNNALHREGYPAEDEAHDPIATALKWMEDNYDAQANPRSGHWWYQWLFSVEQAAQACGYKDFAGRDWYSTGSALLVRKQSLEGRWDIDDTLDNTDLALLFLARGRYPILLNKLKYPGQWNERPEDAANLARWLGWTFEKPVSWQVIDIDAPLEEFHAAPLLYISGRGACGFTERQAAKLRDYVLEGGMIVSEAAANSAQFTLDVQEEYRRMFPAWTMSRLPADHPFFTGHYRVEGLRGLLGIDNGIRTLAAHSPVELSGALQAGLREGDEKNAAVFELLANVYLRATDRGTLLPRGEAYWPGEANRTPAARISVTPVAYAGNCNPEPMALKRLAIELASRYRVKLEVAEPVDIARLDANRDGVTVMTGTDAFQLSGEQAAALREYFADGGTMIVDAAGGSKAFAESVEAQLLSIPPAGERRRLSEDDAMFRWPEDASKPQYRREYAMLLGPARSSHRLIGVRSGGRLAIVYSPADLTAGLVGYQLEGLRGYKPSCALAVMTNLIFSASRSAAMSAVEAEAPAAGGQ